MCQDLLASLGHLRPPYRWLLIGPKRSGSTLHKDPPKRGNTLESGGFCRINQQKYRWEANMVLKDGVRRDICFVLRGTLRTILKHIFRFGSVSFDFLFPQFDWTQCASLFVSTNSFSRSHGLKHGKAFTDLWQDPLGTSAWNALISGRTLDVVAVIGMRYPRYQLI